MDGAGVRAPLDRESWEAPVRKPNDVTRLGTGEGSGEPANVDDGRLGGTPAGTCGKQDERRDRYNTESHHRSRMDGSPA